MRWLTRYLWTAAAVAWTVTVLLLGLSPDEKGSWLIKSFGDKIVHAAAFAVGGLVWAKGFLANRSWRPLYAIALGALTAVLIGLALEVFQRQVPGRGSDVMDFIADVAGVLPAVVLLAAWETSRRRRTQKT